MAHNRRQTPSKPVTIADAAGADECCGGGETLSGSRDAIGPSRSTAAPTMAAIASTTTHVGARKRRRKESEFRAVGGGAAGPCTRSPTRLDDRGMAGAIVAAMFGLRRSLTR